MTEVGQSYPLTATGAAYSGAGTLLGAVLCSGSDAATATITDGISGDVLAKLGAGIAGQSAALGPVAIPFKTGLYVTLTGTDPQLNLFF